MSSMYHEVLGSFADVPAVIRVNGASLDSTVSLSFLHNFNVPRSICNHDGVAAESSSGPVRVPTVDGWYNSRQIFRSVYLKGCDVELGCDWLAFVNARFDGYRFLRPLETDLARLCAGHTWNFEAGATQAGSLSVTQAGSSSVTQAGSSSSSVTEVGSQRKDRVVDKFFDGYENLRRPDLSALAVAHGLSVDDHLSIEDLREIISRHVGMGLCSSPLSQAFEGCKSLRQQLNVHCEYEGEVLSGRIAFLTAILTNTKRRPLERLLKANDVDFELGSKTGRLNIFDTPENNCKLVPMHETYAKLRPGTLVLAVCDAHVYNIVQNGLPTSTFQLGVQAIKILDPSDEPVEERLIPILSPTSTDMSKDNSAVVSFSTFDVAASPTKKAKHAKGGKGKEKMD